MLEGKSRLTMGRAIASSRVWEEGWWGLRGPEERAWIGGAPLVRCPPEVGVNGGAVRKRARYHGERRWSATEGVQQRSEEQERNSCSVSSI